MNQKEMYRLSIGTLLPPFLGVFIYGLILVIETEYNFTNFLSELPAMLLVSYVFLGIQSCIFSVTIEYAILKYFSNTYIVVISAGFLGLVASLLTFVEGLFMTLDLSFNLTAILVGVITALIMFWMKKNA